MTSSSNYEVFRDCLSTIIVEKSNERSRQPSKRKSYKARRNNHNVKKDTTSKTDSTPPPPARANPEDLADFVDVHLPLLVRVLYRRAYTNTAYSLTVPRLRNLPLPPPIPPNPQLHSNPRRPNPPHNPLPNAPPLPSPANPLTHPPPNSARHPNRLRPPRRPARHPRNPPLAAPERLRGRRDRRPARMGNHENRRVRDLRARLDPAVISPSDPPRGARKGGQEGVACGVGVGECGVVVSGVP